MNSKSEPTAGNRIEVPAATGWPLVAAFGFTLVFAGLLTHVMVSTLGAITLCMGLAGWFRQVLPHEAHEALAVEGGELVVPPRGREVRHLEVGELGHRARLPLKIYPYSAGVRGGLVGGAVMAVLAIFYGLVGHGSIWYPVNLLAATGSARIDAMDYNQLLAFHGTGLVLAIIIHVIGSALVGLLYGVSLPMFPRRPILLGGILAPLFWSGILYAGLGIIHPTLQARIDWGWFIVTQFAFGVVAGFVVARHERISTMQHLPFVIRAGVEATGIGEGKPEDGSEL
jgi:hypothetical protein